MNIISELRAAAKDADYDGAAHYQLHSLATADVVLALCDAADALAFLVRGPLSDCYGGEHDGAEEGREVVRRIRALGGDPPKP